MTEQRNDNAAPAMGRAEWGKLTDAWPGEAADFTPELARHIDTLDAELKLGLTGPEVEAPVAGGRRIDILASGTNDTVYVIENQYGRADHDHLTRGLAYAVSADAHGLIVIAEEHRDEFKAVAQYLNDLAAHAGKGIKVWLVEAKAVRVGDSPWAPVFDIVSAPNTYVIDVVSGGGPRTVPLAEALGAFTDPHLRNAAEALATGWSEPGFKFYPMLRRGKYSISLYAPGPAKSGIRSVLGVYPDGRLYVPFAAYRGDNTGIEVPALTNEAFTEAVIAEFGLIGSYTAPGWFTPEKSSQVQGFCRRVIDAYQAALIDSVPPA